MIDFQPQYGIRALEAVCWPRHLWIALQRFGLLSLTTIAIQDIRSATPWLALTTCSPESMRQIQWFHKILLMLFFIRRQEKATSQDEPIIEPRFLCHDHWGNGPMSQVIYSTVQCYRSRRHRSWLPPRRQKRDINKDPYRLRVVGHSLGGAALLIYLVTSRLRKQNHHIYRLILLTPAGFLRKIPIVCPPLLQLT